MPQHQILLPWAFVPIDVVWVCAQVGNQILGTIDQEEISPRTEPGTVFAGIKCHGKGAELADSLLGKIGKGAEAYWKEFSPKLSNFWDKCKFWENWGKK